MVTYTDEYRKQYYDRQYLTERPLKFAVSRNEYVDGSDDMYRSVNPQSANVYPQYAAFPINAVMFFFRTCRRQDMTGSDFHIAIMKNGKKGMLHGRINERTHQPTASTGFMAMLAKPQNSAASIVFVPDNRETQTAKRIPAAIIPVDTSKMAGVRSIFAILPFAFNRGSFSVSLFFRFVRQRSESVCFGQSIQIEKSRSVGDGR